MSERFEIEIYAYVLLDNHYILLVQRDAHDFSHFIFGLFRLSDPVRIDAIDILCQRLADFNSCSMRSAKNIFISD